MSVTNLVDTLVRTPEQDVVHDSLVAYAEDRDRTYTTMLLKGYAGVGKTKTITDVVKTLSESDLFKGKRIGVSAPTHKAVKVLRRFSTFAGEVHFGTIHSILALKESIDDNGKVKFIPDRNPAREIAIEEIDLLILDESSMLSKALYDLITPWINRGLKIIWIGDPIQIPPVGEAESPVFLESIQKKDNIGVLELSTIMRQALDNPILEYATQIRQVYKLKPGVEVHTKFRDPIANVAAQGIIRIDSSDDENTHGILKQYFDSSEFKEDSDYMKVIAWRNDTVNAFNRQIRKHIYKQEDLPLIMENERLVMDAPLVSKSNKILLANNEEIQVKSYLLDSVEETYLTGVKEDGFFRGSLEMDTFRYYNTTVSYFDAASNKEKSVTIRLLHEDDSKKMQGILSGIEAAAKAVNFGNPLRNKLWVSYYNVLRLFAQVKYNYALTAHKSQGSSYMNVMMVDWDIDKNISYKVGTNLYEERNRIRYVAATRARNLLYVIQ